MQFNNFLSNRIAKVLVFQGQEGATRHNPMIQMPSRMPVIACLTGMHVGATGVIRKSQKYDFHMKRHTCLPIRVFLL